MISDQLLNPSHTQPLCLADKSKVEQAVKRFGTAVQLSGFESVSDALPHASALQKKKKGINNLHGITLKFHHLPQTCVTLIC